MADLFDFAAEKRRSGIQPMADRMRPRTIEELAGQVHIVGPDKPLRRLIDADEVPSMIFWGPPGSGKTTLAKLIASKTKSVFIELSAVMSGVNDIRQAMREAEANWKYRNQKTILFIDEIHRFNKAQQDSLLPYVENRTVTLIGATTENPSFEVISALLSRTRVFVLNKLEASDIETILKAALVDERGLGNKVDVAEGVVEALSGMADGDARHALNALELAAKSSKAEKGKKSVVTLVTIEDALQRSHLLYDKNGEEHYNIISALHKSMRGSDPGAALYWLGRMLEAGEDPLYVARRLVRFASEDIGMADPQALVQAITAYQASHAIGMPECNVILAQCVVYLSEAPKSNALYTAYHEVADDIRNLPNEPVPLHIRNAPTKLMKNLGYGKGYKYNPDFDGPVDQSYLPERLQDRQYWKRKPQG
ncbi:replication-associated recombination protein A [Candidatus Uhrbacteria bacterium]|nr:MAG: replication-associated recombination protein A [Candidatus Uhrbacteria bacterium]